MSALLKHAVGLGLATLALAGQAETYSFKIRHGAQTPNRLVKSCQPYSNCNMGANVPAKTNGMGLPVPEPLSNALILMGLGMIGFRIRYGNSL